MMGGYDFRDNRQGEPVDIIGAAGGFVRVLATLIGLGCIIAGVVFGVKMFNMIYAALKSPEGVIVIFSQWNREISENLNFPNFGTEISVVASIIIPGAGVLALLWIAFGFMKTGAKIVSWTASDREAVKKILNYTIGYRIQTAAAAAAQKAETGSGAHNNNSN